MQFFSYTLILLGFDPEIYRPGHGVCGVPKGCESFRRYNFRLPITICVTTQDFIKFWGKIFVFILLVLIENSQGFKNFLSLFESLIENYFKSSIYFLKNFFEKEQVSKYYFPFFLFKPMQATCRR
jgi:hypothetical protein